MFILFFALPIIFAIPFITFDIWSIVAMDCNLNKRRVVLEHGALKLGVKVLILHYELLVLEDVLSQRALAYLSEMIGTLGLLPLSNFLRSFCIFLSFI